LGNICRSPLAQGIAQKIANERNLELTIDSCGTSAYHIGESPCENSQKIARKKGIDISLQKARQLCQKDFVGFDIIVGLDQNNVNTIQALTDKTIYKLGDFGYDGKDVPDPYFFDGFEGFETVYDMIECCVKELFDVKIGKTL
jgi:protein-tyrosine phosphatase